MSFIGSKVGKRRAANQDREACFGGNCVLAIAETPFGDMVDFWGYATKDNKIVAFDSMHSPEGDTKRMYSTLGWKLDSDNWDCDIPWDECEKAIADGEIEFDQCSTNPNFRNALVFVPKATKQTANT